MSAQAAGSHDVRTGIGAVPIRPHPAGGSDRQRTSGAAMTVPLWLLAALIAPVENIDPVHGETVWRIPFYIFISFGLFGSFALLYSRAERFPVRPFMLVAGSVSIAMQYGAFVVQLVEYPDAFDWYDALVLPIHPLLIPDSWQGVGKIVFLVVPSLGTIATTVMVPILWREYLTQGRGSKRQAGDTSEPR
jgi:hypothetical protein